MGALHVTVEHGHLGR